MILKLFAILLFSLWANHSWAACTVAGSSPNRTLTAASCARDDVYACTNYPANQTGDTVILPACSGGSAGNWGDGISIHWTAPQGATLKGQGNITSSTNYGDDGTTVIIDSNSTDVLFNITVNATGTFTFAGITFQGGTAASKTGVLQFGGPGAIRVHHNKIDTSTYSYTSGGPPNWSGNKVFILINGITGSVDTNTFDLYQNDAPYLYSGQADGDSNGDQSWNAVSGFGGSGFVFVENNKINGVNAIPSRALDCFSASRYVFRYNLINGAAGPEDHATGHSSNNRGCRAKEVYRNSFTVLAGQSSKPVDVVAFGSGSGLVWGNSAATGALSYILNWNVTRKDNTTYGGSTPPTSWGFCGQSFFTGTVNVAANGTSVTLASGRAFYSAVSPTYAITSGATINIDGTDYTVDGNATASALTLTAPGTGGALTGVTYYAQSAWDGNTDSLGYPCVDQPGRGVGDLLAGDFPSKLISGGPRDGTMVWPVQLQEPIYIWSNDAGDATFFFDGSAERVKTDRDYYAQASGAQTNATTPFNGTTGTGWGTLANRPTTCTTGVGYFATDQGTMGKLFRCVASAWEGSAYYEPYTCPHPLTGYTGSCTTTAGVGGYNQEAATIRVPWRTAP